MGRGTKKTKEEYLAIARQYNILVKEGLTGEEAAKKLGYSNQSSLRKTLYNHSVHIVTKYKRSIEEIEGIAKRYWKIRRETKITAEEAARQAGATSYDALYHLLSIRGRRLSDFKKEEETIVEQKQLERTESEILADKRLYEQKLLALEQELFYARFKAYVSEVSSKYGITPTKECMQKLVENLIKEETSIVASNAPEDEKDALLFGKGI